MAGKFIHVEFKGTPLAPKHERCLARMLSYLWAAQDRLWRNRPLSERQRSNLGIYGAILQHQGRVKRLNSIEAREHDNQCVRILLTSIFENPMPRPRRPRAKKQ